MKIQATVQQLAEGAESRCRPVGVNHRCRPSEVRVSHGLCSRGTSRGVVAQESNGELAEIGWEPEALQVLAQLRGMHRGNNARVLGAPVVR